MKKFRFCALCLILAALLSACGRQAAQDVPGAAAVPSPAAVPEATAESTSTPSPTAPAEIGKEFDDLSFLNEEQRQAYEGAYKLNYTLYGLPDNLVGVDVSPRFTQQSDNEGVFVLTVGNYALYENPYTDFTNLMQSVLQQILSADWARYTLKNLLIWTGTWRPPAIPCWHAPCMTISPAP